MKKNQFIVVSAIILGAALSAAAVERHVVRSGKPAADDITGWESESSPIGNGWFGVNVFGAPRIVEEGRTVVLACAGSSVHASV